MQLDHVIFLVVDLPPLDEPTSFERDTDSCVICGADTGIRSSAPIDTRSGYVEGAGQLCATCSTHVFSAH